MAWKKVLQEGAVAASDISSGSIAVGYTDADNYSSWNIEADSGGTTAINSGNDVQIIGGTSITTSRSGNDITITNDAPQTTTGTVTSVATSGTVSGLTLTGGTITTSGTITLGGSISTLNQNTTGSSATCSGLAGSATVLATSRNFQTNLASTSTAGFTGAANCSPGVTGTLPVANGGTALTSISTLLNTNVTKATVDALDITEVGIIDSGQWRGTTVDASYGGTGLTSISTLLNSNVTSVSGNAGTATVLATARNIAGNSFNGSSAITIDIEDLDNVTVSDSAAGGSPSTGDIWIEY